MPRDSSGAYSLPSGYEGVSGQPIMVSQHNPPLEDLAAAMTSSLDRTGKGSMLAPLNMGTYRLYNMGDGVNPQDAATVSQLSTASPVGIVADFAGATPPVGWLLCYGQAVSRTDYAALFAVIGTTWGAGDGTTTFNLPDCRGRVRAGRDNMGGSDAARLSVFWGALARTLGGFFGTVTHVLTTGQMPEHGHSVSGTAASNGAHTHPVSASGTTDSAGQHFHEYRVNAVGSTTTVPTGNSGSAFQTNETTLPAGAHTHPVTVTGTATSAGAHTHPVSGTAANAGSGQAHNNTQPSVIMNVIIKAV